MWTGGMAQGNRGVHWTIATLEPESAVAISVMDS